MITLTDINAEEFYAALNNGKSHNNRIKFVFRIDDEESLQEHLARKLYWTLKEQLRDIPAWTDDGRYPNADVRHIRQDDDDAPQDWTVTVRGLDLQDADIVAEVKDSIAFALEVVNEYSESPAVNKRRGKVAEGRSGVEALKDAFGVKDAPAPTEAAAEPVVTPVHPGGF